MNFEVIVENFPQLLQGAVLTLELIVLSSIVGLAIAVPMAILRTSPKAWVRFLPRVYIFVLRGSPLLVQMFLIYYGLSQFDAVRHSILWPVLSQAYWCAIIALTLNTSAYTAEILRGTLQAVPRGEVEAARALGMNTVGVYRHILLPRAFRLALPAYTNEIVFLIKSTALASTITLLDITGMARTIIAETYTPVEIFLAAGVVYLVLTYVFIYALRRLERHLNAYNTPTA